MTANLAERLSPMDTAWNDSQALGGGGGMPPPGVYQATVDRFDFPEGRNGNLQLKTELVVSSGEHQGARVSIWHDLEDPDRLGWTKGHLELLGIHCEQLSDIEAHLEAVLDTPVEIRLKTTEKDGNTYTNVYVNKRLGDPGPKTKTRSNGRKQKDNDPPF